MTRISHTEYKEYFLEIIWLKNLLKLSSNTPPVENHNHLNYNVSHSGDMVAFAFILDSEIGIDIEKIKGDFEVMGLARNFFSKDEIKSLDRIPEKELKRAFYRCWTRKESFIKAEGSGLSFTLKDTQFH